MIKESPKNKDMAYHQEPVETKTEFHFAGSGIYRPKTILASDALQAQELWLKVREPVEPSKPDNKINK